MAKKDKGSPKEKRLVAPSGRQSARRRPKIDSQVDPRAGAQPKRKVQGWPYQLVIQFPARDQADFDWLLSYERELSASATASEMFDGNDFGSGTMNLFVRTHDPKDTFHRFHALLHIVAPERFPSVVAAYRSLPAGDYVALWPKGGNHFKLM